ncbi:fimbrial protein [Cupriavidus lacunae]|uniref:Fimbrial-type adhesion domain-containing protein n=1 Tax=Cupriavidus lacunae TaxID=2666307 RepID=A0A370NHB3_9BURK|nr:fimbrial protein [Cupriavidus lacunae]RDK04984.1 hypothetical protein DN412_39525 [Cupriavidus lacunae]
MAHAACTLGSGGEYRATVTLPGNVSIPRDAVVGSVIASGTFNYAFNQQSPVGVYCSGSATADYLSGSGATSSNGVIPTGIAGIGYKVTAASYVLNTGSVTIPTFDNPANCNNPPSGKCYVYLGAPVLLQLVKTGDIGANAQVPRGVVMTQTIGGIEGSALTLANAVTVVPTTCTVVQRDIAVTLPSIKASTLAQVGAVSPATAFDLSVNCSGVTSTLAVTFTDGNNAGNRSSALELTSASTASGVGVQILWSGNPVSYGPDSSVAGNVNQVTIGAVSNTVYKAPVSARYVRIASAMNPGAVFAAATFTMSYQ